VFNFFSFKPNRIEKKKMKLVGSGSTGNIGSSGGDAFVIECPNNVAMMFEYVSNFFDDGSVSDTDSLELPMLVNDPDTVLKIMDFAKRHLEDPIPIVADLKVKYMETDFFTKRESTIPIWAFEFMNREFASENFHKLLNFAEYIGFRRMFEYGCLFFAFKYQLMSMDEKEKMVPYKKFDREKLMKIRAAFETFEKTHRV
jgi:hypothetical protein